jgi:hypothetical protein
MATLHTHTLTVDTPVVKVAADLADPTTHPEWATEFYAGPVRLVPNGDGVDVLWTLARFPGAWRPWATSSRPSSAATRPRPTPTRPESASEPPVNPGTPREDAAASSWPSRKDGTSGPLTRLVSTVTPLAGTSPRM